MNNIDDNSIYIELLSFFEELDFERFSSNSSLPRLESINSYNNEFEDSESLQLDANSLNNEFED